MCGPQLEDFIPECEEFYKKKHNGRKLYWHHIMSNGVVRGEGGRKGGREREREGGGGGGEKERERERKDVHVERK